MSNIGTATPSNPTSNSIAPTTENFIARVVPWPKAGEPGVINLHWRAVDTNTGKTYWSGRPQTNVQSFVSCSKWCLKRPNIADQYFCSSLQAKIGKTRAGRAKVARSAQGAVSLKAVWLDIDVKDPPRGYATTEEAVKALQEFLRATKLPHSTAVVFSGSGGMHVYWINNQPLSLDDWRPYAEGLKGAALHFGLRCDAGLTTDCARILRVPETLNFKSNPPKLVELKRLAPEDLDFEKDLSCILQYAHKHAPCVTATVTLESTVTSNAFEGPPPKAFAGLTDSLADGIGRSGEPVNARPLFEKDGCPFFRDALGTHGKDHDQPLWNLVVLSTTFMEKGNVLAHALGDRHPGYTPDSTDAMYERKDKERQEKALGWPNCKTFEDNGCKFCAACPHKGKIKTPLHLAVPLQTIASPRLAPETAGLPSRDEKVRDADFRDLTQHGAPKASLANAVIALRMLGIEAKYDLFHRRINVVYKGTAHTIRDGLLTDDVVSAARSLINNTYKIDCGDSNTLSALKEIAFDNQYDPVLDLLAECQGKWDGVKRLDTWVVRYLGCEDTPLNRAIGRLVLIAGCRRARDPGCKFDMITVLEGEEGLNKSTAIRTLAGDDNFSDQSILAASDKEVQEQLEGVWMHENADLAGMRRADVEQIKAFASRQVDRARPAYGRVREDRPRRSIEWGTTNNDRYLLSQTGNRRFWPLETGKIDIEALKRDREQLLGEAAAYEAAGETITLDASLWGDAKAAQEQRRVVDPWEDILLNMPNHVIHRSGNGSEHVATADLLEHVLGIPKAQQTSSHGNRLALAMKHVGWSRNSSGRVTINGKPVRGYLRLTSSLTRPSGVTGILGLTSSHGSTGLTGPSGPTRTNGAGACLTGPTGPMGGPVSCPQMPTGVATALAQAQADLALIRTRT